MRVSSLRSITIAALLLGGAAPAAHAVAVSPAALYLDSRTRSGMLTLFNPGSLPEEIEIGFAFGYPVSDSGGVVSVQLLPTAPDGEPSLVPYLRAFPRRIRLEPGQRQVVRILVTPPADLPAGEYWGRVTVLSRGGQPPVEQRQGAVTMRIDLQTQVLVAVSYRNGAVGTGVALTGATAEPDSGGLKVTLDLARQGNAAYLGRVQLTLLAPDGGMAGEVLEDVAVYHALRRVLHVRLPGPELRGYALRVTVAAERPDLPPGGALPAPAITAAIPLP